MTFSLKRIQFVIQGGDSHIAISGRKRDGERWDNYVTISLTSPEEAEQASKDLLEAAIQMRSWRRTQRGEALEKLYAQRAEIDREIKAVEAQNKREETAPQVPACWPPRMQDQPS